MRFFKLKTITRGMCIPWGLSWYTELYPYGVERKQLVLCIRLPFYWRQHDAYYNEAPFGSAVLRVRFWDDFKIYWVPDYNFCNEMINLKEIYHG